MTPKRIQRKRSAGWRMPEGAVYVGRPGRWGNPYRAGFNNAVWLTTPEAVSMFRYHIAHMADLRSAAIAALRGRDLACWCRLCPAHADGKPLGVTCPDCEPCHADVLLEIANAPEETNP